jgi:hypothetical protein
MIRDETTQNTTTSGDHAPDGGQGMHPRRKRPLPPVTCRSSRGRSGTIAAFLAACRALSGAPSGGIDATITVSADPARWRYAAELVTSEKFAGSELQKSVIKLTACIGWDWGSTIHDNPWEAPVAADELVALGANPVAPPEPAEAAWHVHTLCKSATPYVLMPWPVLAVQRGPVCVIQAFNDRPMAKTREIAAAKLTNAVRLFTLSRFFGDVA